MAEGYGVEVEDNTLTIAVVGVGALALYALWKGSNILGGATKSVTDAVGGAGAVVSNAAGGAGQLANDVVHGTGSVASAAIGGAGQTFNNVVGGAGQTFNNVVGGAGQTFRDAFHIGARVQETPASPQPASYNPNTPSERAQLNARAMHRLNAPSVSQQGSEAYTKRKLADYAANPKGYYGGF